MKKLSEIVNDWKKDIVSGPFGSNLVVADYTNEGVPIIRLQNIQRMKFLNSEIKYVTLEKAEELKRHSYIPGDIVIAKLGDPIGKTCIVPKTLEKGIIVADVVRVRVNESENDVNFMEYLLNSNLIFEQLNIKIIGSTRPRVNLDDVRNLIIPVPKLLEQKKIVNKLNNQMAQIEMMKKEIEANISNVKVLFYSYQKNIFETKIYREYPKISLIELTSKIGSGLTPNGGQSVYQQAGIPLIRSMNIHLNEFRKKGLAHISSEIDESMKNTRVMKGDVLLNITGASIGRVCVVPDEICPANVNQHVSILRTNDRLDPNYLSYYLSNPNFQKFIMDSESGATRQALTKSKIEQFEIPLPTIEIQNQIVNQLNVKKQQSEELLNQMNQQLNAINQLPASILNEVFWQYQINS